MYTQQFTRVSIGSRTYLSEFFVLEQCFVICINTHCANKEIVYMMVSGCEGVYKDQLKLSYWISILCSWFSFLQNHLSQLIGFNFNEIALPRKTIQSEWAICLDVHKE